MTRNTGKSSERAFTNCLAKLYGKRAYIHRFDDASDLHGMNKRVIKVNKQPADFLVVLGGVTMFAEIKSCANATRFPFTSISSHQLAQAKATRAAGGKYFFFVHKLGDDTFYMLDSAKVDRVSKTRSSLGWSEMNLWSDYESYKGR